MLLQPLVFTSCGGDEPDAPDSGGTEGLDIVIRGDTAPKGIQFRRINETDFMLNYVTYSITDGHLSVIGGDNLEIGAVLNGKVSIVSSVTIDGVKYPVREIENRAFKKFDNIIQIDLPNSISKIGSYAFNQCLNLENIKLPDNLTCIPDGCFSGCKKLESLKIPNSTTIIESYAFCETNFRYFLIPDKVTVIGERSFSYCNNLEYIICGRSVKKIDGYAFSYCKKIRCFYFLGSVPPDINYNAFYFMDGNGYIHNSIANLIAYCLSNSIDRYNANKVFKYYFSKIETFDPKTLPIEI